MEKLKHREHDFSAKLRQNSVIGHLREYILWKRSTEAGALSRTLPAYGPISINLDITSACNFACPHCVDSQIITTGQSMKLDDVRSSIDTLQDHGLLSVILIGGGEPTVHKDFEDIVRHVKNCGLQLGIVTNGARLDRVAVVAGLMEKKDWLRLSLDAATQKTFEMSHRPRFRVNLLDILANARAIKSANPDISLGYSFVIVWEGIRLNGNELCPNIQEMADAVRLAGQYQFDYVSFKPCLIRLQGTQKESLLDHIEREQEQKIRQAVRSSLQKAKDAAAGTPAILESINLRAMMEDRVEELKTQPHSCHLQFFRTVVSPSGIFHCPAFRGVDKARVAGSAGYADKQDFDKTLQNVGKSITEFDAIRECSVVGCFYHHVNWWIEDFIQSDRSVDEIQQIEDDNFFL